MKKIIVVIILFLVGFSTQSQEIKKKKTASVSFTVDGVCGMCKKRIETAALKTKGVKFALWNVQTHQLNVILDERKTDVATIQKNIVAVGHDVLLNDNSKLIATNEAYNTLHICCKYRDDEMVLDFKGE